MQDRGVVAGYTPPVTEITAPTAAEDVRLVRGEGLQVVKTAATHLKATILVTLRRGDSVATQGWVMKAMIYKVFAPRSFL